MLKRVVKYVDFDGNEREETLYFNFTKAEVIKMEMSMAGGLVNYINRLVETKDESAMVTLWEEIILSAYGEKSSDGRRFIKGPDIRKAFSETQAFSDLFIELSTDTAAASAFVNSIIPQPEAEPVKTG